MEYFGILYDPAFIKYFLLATNGAFIVVTALMFTVLVVHKSHVERRQRKLELLQAKYAHFLARKQAEPDLSIDKPRSDLEFEALGNAVIELMAAGSDPALASHLRTLARALELDLYNQERALSKSWVDRYQAVEKLGFLMLSELVPFYRSILEKEKNNHVITKTIWALSLVADENDLDIINYYLADPLFASSKFKEYVYTNVIRAFQERGEEAEFVRLLDSWEEKAGMPLLLKKEIISACGVAQLAQSKGAIVRYYRRFRDFPEMKIACVRALEHIGGSEVCPVIASALQDDDWRVRAAAAKNAEVCSESIVDSLESVLKDRNYYVRINAAQALSRLGEKGLAVLDRYTSSDDLFARDMAHYMLSR